MKSRRGPLFFLLCFLSLYLWGCNACDSGVLAELKQKDGQVARDFADEPRQWKTADIGATFKVGDAVRTYTKASTTLKLADGANLQLEADTTVRFSASAPGKQSQSLDVETGQATLEASAGDLRLQTKVGVAVLQSGTRLRLRPTAKGMGFSVEVGAARLEQADGKTVELEAGDGVEVGVGMAVIERFETDDEGNKKEAEETKKPDAGPDPSEMPTGDIVATVTGNGAAQRGPDDKKWKKLTAGTTKLTGGTTLKVAKGTSIALSRGDQQGQLNAGTFTIGGEGGALFNVSSGNANITSDKSNVIVNVPGGTIVARGGSGGSASGIAVKRDGTSVEAHRGRVLVKTPDGTEELLSGEGATIKKGGEIAVSGRSPKVADFRVGAGSSFAVHDPHPPSIIGLIVGKACPDAAIVEHGTGRSFSTRTRGVGTINTIFERGTHHYQIRCVGPEGIEDKVVAKGRIAIIHDGGTAQLPRSAPATRVDVDGRRYTVLYQNLLPKISVSWPNAPKSLSYRLLLSSSPGGSRTLTTGQPNYSFKAGALGEGTHQLTFETSNKRSRTTTLSIAFDNAAPTASLRSPADRSFSAGSTVGVSGVAQPGWEVWAGGKQIPMDGQQRFAGRAAAPSGDRALAIRFSHPNRGVHYYLRRVAGSD